MMSLLDVLFDSANAQRRLSDFQKKILIEKPFKQSGDAMVSSLKYGYDKQKDPDGNNWAPLDPANPAYKWRPGADGIADDGKRGVTSRSKALVNTGAMRASIVYAVNTQSYKVRIGYGTVEQAQKAFNHHFGVESMYRLRRISGRIVTWMIKPTVRKNLGFAKWARMSNSGLTDRQMVLKIFQDHIAEIKAGTYA